MNTVAVVVSICVGSTALLTAAGKALRGFYRQMHRIEKALLYVESEMKNNGGSTMRDAVDRVDRRLARLEKEIPL